MPLAGAEESLIAPGSADDEVTCTRQAALAELKAVVAETQIVRRKS